MPRRASLFLLLALSAVAAGSAGVTAAETQRPPNPFMPVNTGGAPVVAANETIEFAGVSQLGKTTHLIFHDKSLKKNRWISIGETVEGISVVKYDPRLELAVIKVNGAEKTLPLRKGTGPVNAAAAVTPLPPPAGFATPVQQPQILPAPAPNMAPDPASQAGTPPAKSPAPSTPETQVKQETEARMLVSDLLEIGMAQRKAYEEAQRRAAEGKTGQPAPPAEQPK